MIRYLGVILFLFSLASGAAYSQPLAFKAGEKLRYIAEYKVGFINVDVATIDLTVDNAIYDGKDCFNVRALAEIMPIYKWFFDLRDEYNVRMRKSDLRPLYLESDIQEGSYTLQGNYVYNWDSMTVKTYENRPVWSAPKRKEHKLTNESLDAISMFYNLRNLSDSAIFNTSPTTIELVFANRIRKVQYRFIGRETIRISGFGKQAALRYKCQLANDSGGSFKDGDEFDLWLSDDINKIPLFVESPIRVGKVRVRLREAEGVIEPLKK